MGIVLVGTALSLAACGGDSDSSGYYNGSVLPPASIEPPQILALPPCVIEGRTIIVPRFTQGCSVKKPDLNVGRIFSLSCDVNPAQLDIEAALNADIQSVKTDIEISPLGKYAYECRG